MEGGADGKVKVVTETDIAKAEQKLKQLAEKKAESKLDSQTSKNFKLLKDGATEEATNIFIEAEPGDAKESFEGEVEITKKVLAYQPEDLSRLIEFNLESDLPKERMLRSGTQEIEWFDVSVDWEEEEADMEIEGKQTAAHKIDKENLKNSLKSKSEKEVREFLSQAEGISKSKVSFWPFWVGSIPDKPERIQIEIKY
jgi:hypothetical protein